VKIAILGPISTSEITPYLFKASSNIPAGYEGAPFMATLIGELLSRGHEVSAFTTSIDLPLNIKQPLIAEGERFKIYYCPARRHSIRMNGFYLGKIVDFFYLERRFLVQAICMDKPDLLHAHWTYEFAMASMDSGIPYLITAHDDPREVLKLYKNIYRFGRYLMAKKVLSNAKVISAVSEDLKRRISPFTDRDIDVVSNPLSRQFTDFANQDNLKLQITPPKLISVINGWGFLKNASSALIAFSHIRKHINEATYHLYGHDFQQGGPAELWAKSKNLAESVFFHGPVPQASLVDAMKDAKLMLHPSRSESCPMGIAEAMALGLPIVGGEKSGGVPWMVGNAGLLVDIERPEEIARAALEILTDDVLYNMYVEAAHQRAKEFLPEIIVKEYEKLYTRILENVACVECN
jgi:L-malate glycosyltransferase